MSALPALLCVLVTKLNPFIAQQARRYASVATRVVLVCDQAPTPADMQNMPANATVYHVPSAQCRRAGFYGMHPHVSVSAWDKVFYYLALETTPRDTAVWCLEYDVYVRDLNVLATLEAEAQREQYDVMLPAIPGPAYGTKTEHKPIWAYAERPRWPWWRLGTPLLAHTPQALHRAHSMIARFSADFVTRCLEWRSAHKRFVFHEMLFATLAKQQNLRCGALHTTNVRWRPVFAWSDVVNCSDKKELSGIFHPVKETDKRAVAVSADSR